MSEKGKDLGHGCVSGCTIAQEKTRGKPRLPALRRADMRLSLRSETQEEEDGTEV